MNYWLMKTEPDTFSIWDLDKSKNKTTPWEGVRNYQARNFMRDEMQKGDMVFFYHSSCKEPGIVGLCTVSKTSYPDFTAFDKKSKYYDIKSTEDNRRWFMVDVKLSKIFNSIVSLKSLKDNPKLADFKLLQRGNRLSIIPVLKSEWQIINKMTDI